MDVSYAPRRLQEPFFKDTYEYSGSPECLSLAAEWLKECLANHERCTSLSHQVQSLPTRVLNVGSQSQNPILYEPREINRHAEWVALSYCWGTEPNLKLTQETEVRPRQGIRLDEFDPTIRDTKAVTRALGITYLWVDALCIFQEDGSEDWSRESPRMKAPYDGSTVTIMAVDSASVREGIFQRWEPTTSVALEWKLSADTYHEFSDSPEKQFVHVTTTPDMHVDEMEGPLTKRGWTMQESLLPS